LWAISLNKTTWTQVLNATSNLASFPNDWGFSEYGNIVVVTECGSRANARLVYLSKDYGKTFTMIF